MLQHYKIPFITDREAGITLPCQIPALPDTMEEVFGNSYQLRLDLTLNKSLMLPNTKQRVVDQSIKKQRSYLTKIISDIVQRYNAFGSTETITKIFTVFEVQPTSGNVHTHSHVHIAHASNDAYALVKIRDIVKSLGFKPERCEISQIRSHTDSWKYLKKADTKYPDFYIYYKWEQ